VNVAVDATDLAVMWVKAHAANSPLLPSDNSKKNEGIGKKVAKVLLS
jgi:hypothetical protein